MRLHSNLCHIEEGKVVVSVIGWVNNREVGSALGQGKTAEIAEDNAINRLKKRIKGEPTNFESKGELKLEQNKSNNEEVNNDKINYYDNTIPAENNNLIDTSKEIAQNQFPSDWSKELAEIDSQIKRLDWKREDELKFLKENFGYHNRNKITNYDELILMRDKLKKLAPINTSKQKSKRKQLIQQSDDLLTLLSWDQEMGRVFIKKQFNVISRSELSEDQLRSFNNILLQESQMKGLS